MSAGRPPAARRARRLALALALAAAPGTVRAGVEPLREVPLLAIPPALHGGSPLRPEGPALVLDAERQSSAVLPLRAAARLVLDVDADAPLLLSWFPFDGRTEARAYGPPWRYLALAPGRRRLDLDLLSTAGWTLESVPVLAVRGTGRLRIERMQVGLFSGGAAEAARAHDLALLLGPDAVGHTSINFIAPLPLEPTTGLAVPELAALAGLAVFAAALAGARLAVRRWRPALAAAAGALAMAAAWDAFAAVRMVPALQLALEPDPERRIRDHYYFAPELGRLAALARASLGPGERVGVLGGPGDWFGPQTLCFNLAPRPCVILEPGAASGHGISHAGSLRLDELDAIVALDPEEPLPHGFAPVALVTRDAFLARRVR